jgi:hypothetical protein
LGASAGTTFSFSFSFNNLANCLDDILEMAARGFLVAVVLLAAALGKIQVARPQL